MILGNLFLNRNIMDVDGIFDVFDVFYFFSRMWWWINYEERDDKY